MFGAHVLGSYGDTGVRLRAAPSDPNRCLAFIACSARLGPARPGMPPGSDAATPGTATRPRRRRRPWSRSGKASRTARRAARPDCWPGRSRPPMTMAANSWRTGWRCSVPPSWRTTSRWSGPRRSCCWYLEGRPRTRSRPVRRVHGRGGTPLGRGRPCGGSAGRCRSVGAYRGGHASQLAKGANAGSRSGPIRQVGGPPRYGLDGTGSWARESDHGPAQRRRWVRTGLGSRCAEPIRSGGRLGTWVLRLRGRLVI